jgi:putative Holliday junction resolvase
MRHRPRFGGESADPGVTCERHQIMRYLCIDPGGRRTGLAVGSDTVGLATPVDVITTASPGERLRLLAQAVREHEPDALVLGLPLNMDGTEGPSAKAVRALAAELGGRVNLPVHLVDERLSSYAAEQKLNRTGLTHGQKKARRDAIAAAAILQQFLDGLASGSTPPPAAV